MMIGSAAEFVALHSSEDPDEQAHASRVEAPVEVWLEVVRDHPVMRFWVAQNKTVPIEVLDVLADDEDWMVRSMVASKRKLPAGILERMADDPHDTVRMDVARHRHTPVGVLGRLAESDPWAEVRRVAGERLGRDREGGPMPSEWRTEIPYLRCSLPSGDVLEVVIGQDDPQDLALPLDFFVTRPTGERLGGLALTIRHVKEMLDRFRGTDEGNGGEYAALSHVVVLREGSIDALRDAVEHMTPLGGLDTMLEHLDDR